MTPRHPMNSQAYWNERFTNGDWGASGGPAQTDFFARVALGEVPEAIVRDIRERRLTVCDWGCGEGEATRLLAEAWGVEVTGIDTAEAALATARARHPGHEFVYSPEGLDRTYDVLFTSNTLEHFQDPWGALERLLPKTRCYAFMLVPFEERARIPEHEYTFELERFPPSLGQFDLVGLSVVDCSRLPETRWPGAQALATYAPRGSPPVERHLDETVARAISRAAMLEAARETLALERDAFQAEARALTDAFARLQSEVEEAAARLERARSPRSYVAARTLAAAIRDPVQTVMALLRSAWPSKAPRVTRLHAGLRAPDPLAEIADVLRALARGH